MLLIEREIYEFGPFVLDPYERILSCQGTALSLTPKAFETLLCLVRNHGHMVSKDDLLKQVWPETFVEEVNLAVNISAIRKALGDQAHEAQYIATVSGRGYRFVAEVRRVVRHIGPDDASSVLPSQSQTVGSDQKLQVETGSTAGKAEAVANSSRELPNLKLAIPVVLFLLITGLVVYVWEGGKATKAASPGSVSIAVLPFSDLSAAHDQQYLSDGLAETLINDLARVPGLKVVSRASSFQFKGSSGDLRNLGRKLGVANVLEGSIQREGDRVRIRAELTKVEDGFQLWSETYDRKIDDLFAVQDEIAHSATAALQLKLLGSRRADGVSSERSPNPEAYEAYLRARYFTTRGRDNADLDHAFHYVQQAIKLDDKYGVAWSLRSYIVDTMADVGQMDPATAFPEARADAERAIELDPDSASGYLALAWVQINRDWNWEGAELSLTRAAELQADSASILRYRSFLAESQGHLKEAIDFHAQAIAKEPLLASSYSYFAYLLYSAGEYKEADAAAIKALELNPQKTYDHFTRGKILLQQGRPAQGLEEMELEPAPIWSLTGKAMVYHAMRRSQDSDAALRQLIKDHQRSMAYQIAEVYAYRGESDKAFQWLDRAYQQRDSGLRALVIDPLLKSLHRDSRYSELLKKMRLPGRDTSSLMAHKLTPARE